MPETTLELEQQMESTEFNTITGHIPDLLAVEGDNPLVKFRRNGGFSTVTDGGRIGRGEPAEAIRVDFALSRLLQEQNGALWRELSPQMRADTLRSARALTKERPVCSNEPRLGEQTVESCRADFQVIRIGCSTPETELLEVEA